MSSFRNPLSTAAFASSSALSSKVAAPSSAEIERQQVIKNVRNHDVSPNRYLHSAHTFIMSMARSVHVSRARIKRLMARSCSSALSVLLSK